MKQRRYNTILASAMLMTTCASFIFFLPVAISTTGSPLSRKWEEPKSTQIIRKPLKRPKTLTVEKLPLEQHKKGSLSLKTAAIIGSDSVKAAILALGGGSPSVQLDVQP